MNFKLLFILFFLSAFSLKAQFSQNGNELLTALGRTDKDSLVASLVAQVKEDPKNAGMDLKVENGKLVQFTLYNRANKEHKRFSGAWPFAFDSNTTRELVSFAFGAPEKVDNEKNSLRYELPGVDMTLFFSGDILEKARFDWSEGYREAGKSVQIYEIQDYINRKFRKRIYANGECREGNCKDGKGEMEWRNQLKYRGDFKHKFAHGQGRAEYPKGGYYEGEFKWGYPHGQGVEVTAEGQKWEGGFAYGERDGEGTLTLPDGIVMKGRYEKGKMNGPWIIRYPSGQEVTIQYLDGKLMKN